MRTREIKIQDVMTMNPDWCLPESTTMEAGRMMKETDVGILPVVDSELGRKLIGVVTDRDLCLSVVAAGKHPDSVRVREAMTSQVVTCQPDDDIRKAIHLMQGNQVRRIPVVDRQGMIQGMVSTADIVQQADLSSNVTHETMKEVTKPTDQPIRSKAKMKRAA